jgi:hypothetical protein
VARDNRDPTLTVRVHAPAPEVPVADINLTQEDADALLAMEKHKVDDSI